MIARLNCRIVSGRTAARAAPSRRWRCQSSGSVIVILIGVPGLKICVSGGASWMSIVSLSEFGERLYLGLGGLEVPDIALEDVAEDLGIFLVVVGASDLDAGGADGQIFGHIGT